jgi:predicted RND superfamily exporter protein
VFLTTVSTVGGLLPIILESDFQAQMVIPMAISIACGVAFATLLTLILIPALFSILNDMRLLVYKVRKGNWPTREAVEPAVQIHTELEGASEGYGVSGVNMPDTLG